MGQLINEQMMGILLALLGIYLLYKYFNMKKDNPDAMAEVLSEEDYQVKGQWDK